MSKKNLYLLVLSSLLVSCGSTCKIPGADYRLIPYAGEEILVFESNRGEVDTIFLEGTGRTISPTDPLDLFPTRLEHFYILNKHSDPSPPDGIHRYLDGHILVEISADENKDTRLRIDFNAKDARFYGDSWFSKSESERMPRMELVIHGIKYPDVILFTDSEKNYSDRSNFVDKLYWSMRDGIVRYDKKNNETWVLKKKYTP